MKAAALKSARRLWSPPMRKRALDLGLYGHSAYTPFVILGRSRVGSNLLRGLLNSNAEIVAFGEIFRDTGTMDWDHTGYFRTPAMHTLVRTDPVQFLDAKVLGRYPAGVRAVGFKLFYYHAQDGPQAGVWPYLRQRGDLKVIHLKRKNLLRTHFSRKRAAMTDSWVSTSRQPDAEVAIRVDYEECLRDFVLTRAWEEEAARAFAGHEMLELEYEDLATDYRREGRKIQDFLDLEPKPLNPATFQQVRQPLSSCIANYAELREKFRGTRWEEFLTD